MRDRGGVAGVGCVMGMRHRLDSSKAIESLNNLARQAIIAGKPIIVDVVTENKTQRQRRYQFGWFYDQAVIQLQEAGIAIERDDGSRYPYDVEILHEVLKQNVLRPLYMKWGKRERITAKGGKVLLLPVSTERDNDGKTISIKEFSDYISECRRFLWEWREIVVPEPMDGEYAKFADEMRRAA